jgi:hypothetical protein
MSEPHTDPGAAQPPDAGHTGSFTRPDETLTYPPQEPGDEAWPPLASDTVRAAPRRSTISATAITLLALVVVALSLTGLCQG